MMQWLKILLCSGWHLMHYAMLHNSLVLKNAKVAESSEQRPLAGYSDVQKMMTSSLQRHFYHTIVHQYHNGLQ